MSELRAGRNILSALSNAARAHPENGFVFDDLEGRERRYPYPELEREVLCRAAALRARDLRHGDRVGLVVIDTENFVLTFLAAMRAGLVPVPLYPPLSLGEFDAYLRRMTAILDSAGAHALVVSSRLRGLISGLLDDLPGLGDVLAVESLAGEGRGTAPLELPEPSGDELAFLQYTSGSTSAPKGVRVTHECLRVNTEAIIDRLAFRRGREVFLSWLPLYHDMGVIGFVCTPIFAASSSVLLPTLRFLKQPRVWMRAVHRNRATITFCPPFALNLAVRRSLPEDLPQLDLSCLRVLGIGAEPISPDGMRAFQEMFGKHCRLGENALTPAYGMAEATLAVAMKSPHAPTRTNLVDAARFQDEGRAVPARPGMPALEHVSCGPALTGHEIAVVDASGRRLPEDHEGELVFGGPSVTPGYHESPEATAESFRDGWIHTGDLGYVHEGEVCVTGRRKDLVIINGRNYHPQEIEWSVTALPGVRKGAVIAFSRPASDTEELVIALEATKDAPLDLVACIKRSVGDELGLLVADVVVLRPGLLPKTSSGKLQRRRTRELYLADELGAQGSREKRGGMIRPMLARHYARSLAARLRRRLGIGAAGRARRNGGAEAE